MGKNRQKTKKWKFKIVFCRRKRLNSKENYWKDWFSKTKLGPNWQKKFKKEVFEFKISLIPTGITENQNIVIGYRLIIFAHLFKLKPLLFIVFMMNFWIVSVIFRRSALHNALWPLVSRIHFSSCKLFSNSTRVVSTELEFMLQVSGLYCQ